MGFTDTDTDTDIASLSDTLVDQLVVWGDADAITARVSQHLDAGADHVVIHVLNGRAARQLARSVI